MPRFFSMFAKINKRIELHLTLFFFSRFFRKNDFSDKILRPSYPFNFHSLSIRILLYIIQTQNNELKITFGNRYDKSLYSIDQFLKKNLKQTNNFLDKR